MHHIDIVGLGPGDPGQMTLETIELLRDESPNFFRTQIHPVMDFILKQGIEFESFDADYESEDSFEAVYDRIVQKLIKKAKSIEKLVYAVPGNPLFGEKTVEKLIVAAKKEGVTYHIYPGVSFVDVTLNALEKDPIAGLKVMDASDPERMRPDPNSGNLVTQVYSQYVASELKLRLMEIYDAEKQVILLINSGIPNVAVTQQIPLYKLDRCDQINHLTSLYIPPEVQAYHGLEGMVDLIKMLRSDEGCDWDRAQTHESLRICLLEEAYEVLDAIDNQDWENLEEELGDVLFHIVFHAQLASEAGSFNMHQVIHSVNQKMIRRHPHVFMDAEMFNAPETEKSWDAIKRIEKGQDSQESEERLLAMEMKKMPRALPALVEAHKVQKKAAKVDYVESDAQVAVKKLKEVVSALETAIVEEKNELIVEKLGVLLFMLVNISRLCTCQSEMILRQTTKEFIQRFEKNLEI